MSMEKQEQDILYTPCKAQKCLFGVGRNSSNKSLYRNPQRKEKNYDSSGEDSDLGPISPLTHTERSQSGSISDLSSPTEYVSPLATPEEISSPVSLSWDRLTPNSKTNNSSGYDLPMLFSNLKKITRAARYSPRKKILPDSPKSISDSPEDPVQRPCTPKQFQISENSNEIIPETPKRSFGTEIQNDSPLKLDTPQRRLITPIGSEIKTASVPKLHRRKSLCILDRVDDSSQDRKENVLKRRAQEALTGSTSKLLKTDENYSIPKARAALFQEHKNDKLKNITLSTTSFYNNAEKTNDSPKVHIFRSAELPGKKRKIAHISYGKQLKKRNLGRINAGVSHGIKKSKPRSSLDASQRNSLNNSKKAKSPEQKVPAAPDANETDSPVISLQQLPSPEIDPNKRFFKTKNPGMQYNATVTVNGKIKLKVANGKITLNQKPLSKGRLAHKRQKTADISFDASDLTVDEPEVEASAKQCKVDNILKVLENDWADDEYDTMEPLTNKVILSSPKTLSQPSDITMSPTSELSNMTSTMNIEDAAAPTSFENVSFKNTANDDGSTQTKYFPIFSKGYSAKVPLQTETRSGPQNNKKLNWQLTAKTSGGDDQYQLDAGQKRFGATQCSECGLVYQQNEPEDELAHLNYHNRRNSLKFKGWKTERIIFEDPVITSRIILVEPTDSKQCWNKVMNILTIVDRDLGLDSTLSEYQNKKVYLYIRDQTVLGVLVAEHIESSFRMIPDLLEFNCCTNEPVPAKCGIYCVWTVITHRRQGIATKLVDVLRGQFQYGYIMTMDDIAFSMPTPSGKQFAEKYTKTRNFKVYS